MIASRFVSLIALFILVGALPCSAAAPRFTTRRVDGRNYVTLREFGGFYGFGRKWSRNQQTILLKKKYLSLQLKMDSREAVLNRDHQEIRLHLNFAPMEQDGEIMISELDVIKTLDPVLRPWSVAEFKVRTVLIDAGHGGFDRGTLGVTPGVMEKTYSLDTAKRLERFLKLAGYHTLMTRREDEYISLEDRAEQANVSSADLLISIHFNSASPDRGPSGVETYCLTPAGAPSTGNLGDQISDYQSNPGNKRDASNMLLAYCVHQSIIQNLDVSDRGVKRARFVVIKETNKTSILVECGFLSNPSEQSRIRAPAHREKLARSICQGILKFISYVSPKKPAAGPLKLRDAS